MGWRLAPLAALALGAAGPQGGALEPMRDVVARYEVDGAATGLIPGGLPGPVRLSWDAEGRRLRAEAEGRSQVAVLDLARGTGTAFDTGLRLAFPFRIKARDLQALTLEGARLRAGSERTVAGLRCREYVVEARGRPGSVCLTKDRVALAGSGEVDGKPGRFTAVSVHYGAVPESLFQVPEGYFSFGGRSGLPAPDDGLGGVGR